MRQVSFQVLNLLNKNIIIKHSDKLVKFSIFTDINELVYTTTTNIINKLDKNIKKYIDNTNLSKTKSILKAFLNKHKNIITKSSELDKVNTTSYNIYTKNEYSIVLSQYRYNKKENEKINK
jgi:hypothetical protein